MDLIILFVSVVGALGTAGIMHTSTSNLTIFTTGALCALFSALAVDTVLKMVRELIHGKDDDDDFDKLAGA